MPSEGSADPMQKESFDIVILGGGIAGIAAAVSAGRTGLNVALIEQYGFLGGSATAGMVSPFMKHALEGRPLVRGVFEDLEYEMRQMGGMIDNGFSAQAFRTSAFELLRRAGVHLIFGARLASVMKTDNRITAAEITTGTGNRLLEAKVFIDTTGDAQLLYLGRLSWLKGDEKTGHLQAMTLFFRMAKIDLRRVCDFARQHKEDFFDWMTFDFDFSKIISIAGFFSQVKKAIIEKRLPEEIQYIFFTTLPATGEGSFNTTNILGIDGSTSRGMTAAEITGRRQVHAVVEFLCEDIPGFEDAFLLETATQIGVRETRRAVGDYQVTGNDILEGHKFDDAIARGVYGIDIHGQKGEKSRMEDPAAGKYYEIPRRALIVRDAENVLIAGRCISATREGHSALRIMPTSAATGEACGVWAALAVQKNVSLRAVPVEELQMVLRHNLL